MRGEDCCWSASGGERVAVAVGLGESDDDAGAGQSLADELDESARDPERLGAALELGVGHGHVVAQQFLEADEKDHEVRGGEVVHQFLYRGLASGRALFLAEGGAEGFAAELEHGDVG